MAEGFDGSAVPGPGADVDPDPQETREWLDSLEYIFDEKGAERASWLLNRLEDRARRRGLDIPLGHTTPYCNTIPPEKQPPRPGDREMERRIKSMVRWNALAMVVRANLESPGIGGHISTYASSATLYEVGFNHFFKGPNAPGGGDQIFFQGHASPGIYGRAFLEGRLTEQNLKNFRRELGAGGGLPSYPHPWLKPDFWQFPTVSMGLGPVMSIFQARFNRYLRDRGIKDTDDCRVWAFLGDGECDEPEALGCLTVAAREGLDNLTWVVNCNLQRLDGPVRGNGKIIQELEGIFRGAGWNVIKVVWSGQWDVLLQEDKSGLLLQRMMEVVDGQYQKYSVSPGSFVRQDFFGKYPELAKLVERMSDEEIQSIKRGGHDPDKVYAAFWHAVRHRGRPTVILAKTIKGFGLGEYGEGQNVAHNQKSLGKDETQRRRAILLFRDRFGIALNDEEAVKLPFVRFKEDSPEFKYLTERRAALGGPLPQRRTRGPDFKAPALEEFKEFFGASREGQPMSTTMAFVRILNRLMGHKEIGKLVVPIVPDEGRTFGMEGLYARFGIYAALGQLYTPVDAGQLQYYKEARNGQVLQEGINEAGGMASFVAAGSAYSVHGVNTIPFYIYYSMFGFQRVGDLIWAAGDMRCRGFLMGGTAGRTTLNGEGLQHEDGHSQLMAMNVPNCRAYDAAFGYELAVIIQDGLRVMYEAQEGLFYYLTVENENYDHLAMPVGAEEGIVRGIYRVRPGPAKKKIKAHLWGSGSILNCALKAQGILEERYGVSADVWSVTSYKALRQDALEATRWNMLHPAEPPRKPWVTQLFEGAKGPVIAATDYMRALPDLVAPFVPGGITSLGTDGFGRSETREGLRRHFEVDAESIAVATLHALARRGEVEPRVAAKAIGELGIDPEKPFSLLI
ncbi:MAG TPA: pyruvate dehydrogenase (acetyl-transferring), homodimeric type [Verrucomicrobiae bacterium]|nr:pyruvate dehydrogenase (acetyl-transferring), homodimeric type [Verrucomicrobiae bacterium]